VEVFFLTVDTGDEKCIRRVVLQTKKTSLSNGIMQLFLRRGCLSLSLQHGKSCSLRCRRG